jgi:hypothetical protein
MEERAFSNTPETSVEEGEYPPRFPESYVLLPMYVYFTNSP